MKRVVFLILLVAVAFWIIARARIEHERMRFDHLPPRGGVLHPGHGHGARRGAAQTHEQLATRKLAEARAALDKAKAALDKAGHEVKSAVGEARQELQGAMAKARQAFASAKRDLDAIHAESIATLKQGPGREEVEGIPVPVISGTRVTDAVAQPPAPAPLPAAAAASKPLMQVERTETAQASEPAQRPTRSVEGRISATGERAKNDAFLMLASDVCQWLDPQVPQNWAPPVQLLQAMVLKTDVKEVPKEYGPMYVATLTYDSSPARRDALIATYNHELVHNRMMTLSGALAFVLIGLAAVSGYIRADEATKGYYTNRLRMLVAAGVGAAGVIIYQMLR